MSSNVWYEFFDRVCHFYVYDSLVRIYIILRVKTKMKYKIHKMISMSIEKAEHEKVMQNIYIIWS